MNQTELFKYLGAPLHNNRWSWGGVRPTDGAIVLRVWQDQKRKIDGKWYMELTSHRRYLKNPSDSGYAERLRHVELIKAGARTLMVMCEAKDIAAQPRDIKSFNDREVFVGGEIVESDGDWWLGMVERKTVQTARLSGL